VKIYYLSIFDVLRARTNQIADMRMCEGFSQAGCEVEMITPYVYRHDNLPRDRVFEVYGIRTPFRLRMLPTPFVDDMPAWVVLPVMLVLMALTCLRIWFTNRGRLSGVVIMSQTTDLLIPALLLRKLPGMTGPLIVGWCHDISFRKRYEWVYRRVDALIATNSAITGDLSGQLGIPPERMAISLNPISEAQLADRVDRATARSRLGLELAEPLVVYTGKLFVGQREAEYILEAARRLPGYRFLLTGGKAETVAHYREFCRRERINNVVFVGFLHDYRQVHYYQAAADVLVSYYTTDQHLTRYQLPNKTCEYMLAANPIVTTDFPATRDVLNSENVIYVDAENPEALAAGIRRAIEDPDLARRVSSRALQDVRKLTYRQRAASIAAFFRGHQPPEYQRDGGPQFPTERPS